MPPHTCIRLNYQSEIWEFPHQNLVYEQTTCKSSETCIQCRMDVTWFHHAWRETLSPSGSQAQQGGLRAGPLATCCVGSGYLNNQHACHISLTRLCPEGFLFSISQVSGCPACTWVPPALGGGFSVSAFPQPGSAQFGCAAGPRLSKAKQS